MSNEQKLREAFDMGWKMAANWSLSDHLLADMESPAYLIERDGRLLTLSLPITTTPSAAAPAPAVPQGEPVDFDSIIADIEAIDCVYRGDPSYDYDPRDIREQAANVVRHHATHYVTPAAPSQPVTLTDEEIRRNWSGGACPQWGIKFARAIIAALREKEALR